MELIKVEGGVCAPKGFVANGVNCGIRKNREKNDLALIFSRAQCAAASVYTQNKVFGAPITVTRRHLENGRARAIICNSGNANTCNANGVEIAEKTCALAAAQLGLEIEDIVVASTGVIGQKLSIEPILKGLPELVKGLSATGNDDACMGIMTTDTFMKQCAYSFTLGGASCAIGAMAKGSGMIHPNMATMLCFVTTDAAIAPELLRKAVKTVADDTFNMISVDGDTSTNDMLTVLANGQCQNALIDTENQDYARFCAALEAVCRQMAIAIAADGEGATKLLTCVVEGAGDKSTARRVAKSVITSSLFKAAMFGCDANWGRILCAIGYADCPLDMEKVDVALSSQGGSVAVCKGGAGMPFDEPAAFKILDQKQVDILINLNDGGEKATAWGCDLTYGYVKINGEYRT